MNQPTPCSCTGEAPLWCHRHKMEKGPNALVLCQTNDRVRRLWDCKVGDCAPAAAATEPSVHGPGTELKKLLKLAGYQACAKCGRMAARMDRNGPQWCRDNMGEILDHLRAQAKKKGVKWYTDFTAKRLIRLAIYLAERNSRVQTT